MDVFVRAAIPSFLAPKAMMERKQKLVLVGSASHTEGVVIFNINGSLEMRSPGFGLKKNLRTALDQESRFVMATAD